MAKRTQRTTIKGLLDIDAGTITEFLKDEGEVTHNINDLLLSYNGLDNVSISVSHDLDIVPE